MLHSINIHDAVVAVASVFGASVAKIAYVRIIEDWLIDMVAKRAVKKFGAVAFVKSLDILEDIIEAIKKDVAPVETTCSGAPVPVEEKAP